MKNFVNENLRSCMRLLSGSGDEKQRKAILKFASTEEAKRLFADDTRLLTPLEAVNAEVNW